MTNPHKNMEYDTRAFQMLFLWQSKPKRCSFLPCCGHFKALRIAINPVYFAYLKPFDEVALLSNVLTLTSWLSFIEYPYVDFHLSCCKSLYTARYSLPTLQQALSYSNYRHQHQFHYLQHLLTLFLLSTSSLQSLSGQSTGSYNRFALLGNTVWAAL